MPFQTTHTDYGLSRLVKAEATGTPINLPEMAVGECAVVDGPCAA